MSNRDYLNSSLSYNYVMLNAWRKRLKQLKEQVEVAEVTIDDIEDEIDRIEDLLSEEV